MFRYLIRDLFSVSLSLLSSPSHPAALPRVSSLRGGRTYRIRQVRYSKATDRISVRRIKDGVSCPGGQEHAGIVFRLCTTVDQWTRRTSELLSDRF